jgi:hypothetical protein
MEFRLIPIKIVNLFKGTNGLKKAAGSKGRRARGREQGAGSNGQG